MRNIQTTLKKLLKKETLVLTLLVKNEADIILDNIFFHYAVGVDHIIVTDNGSTDGTLEILERLENDKFITLIKEEFYNQDKIVNSMGRLAKEKHGATMLIHADADEFWNPLYDQSLKTAFLKIAKPAISIERKDVLPIPEEINQNFPQLHMNMITKHLRSKNVKKDSQKTSLFVFWLPSKVMFSIEDGLKEVGFGNHYLAEGSSGEIVNNIIIFHFPFKSKSRFVEKVIIGGEAFRKIKTSGETGWHWKRWYKEYLDGQLDQEINLLVPNLKDIPGLEFREFDYNKEVRGKIKKNTHLNKLYNHYWSILTDQYF